MNTPRSIRRLTACLMLGLASAAHGQLNYLDDGLRDKRVAIEGRSVAFYAHGAKGRVQWQVSNGDNPAWVNLIDDAIYRGTTTHSLELTAATKDLAKFSFRYTDTVVGITTASKAFTLNVTPLVFPMPTGLILDGIGGLLISDASDHTIRRVDNALLYGWGNDVVCMVNLPVGRSGQAGAVDGSSGEALFNQPNGLALVGSEEILVADTANGTIRRIKGGDVTTVAGNSSVRGNVDGAAVAARFSAPIGIARNPDGSFYVADSVNHTIRKVAPDGSVSTFAGSAGMAGYVDGTGTAARFHNPTGVTVDFIGNVYVSDTTNNLIRRITPAGVVTTVAGIVGVAGSKDGKGGEAMFNGPTGLTAVGTSVTPGNGYLYVADTGNSTIRSVIIKDGNVEVVTYAGVPGVGGLRDGTDYDNLILKVLFNQPKALVWHNSGLLFVADTGNAAIRVISHYDGVCLTLPLQKSIFPSFNTPPDPTLAPVSPPAKPSIVSNNSGSSGGGGAPSGWFLAALAGVWLLRRLAGGRTNEQRAG